MLRRTRWPLAFNDRRMQRAARFARSSARRLRLMILTGILLYGRSMARKEFLLRRITTLSLYFYGLIAMLASVETARKSGRPIDADLDLLAYFLEEARQTRKLNRRMLSNRLEKAHRKITSRIVREVETTRQSQRAN